MMIYNDSFQAIRVLVACGHCFAHSYAVEVLHHTDRFIMNMDDAAICPTCGKKKPYARIEAVVQEGQQGG